MNTSKATESLLRRNATACEQAKHPQCTCACGGALHGKHHSEEWLSQTAAETYERQFKYIKAEFKDQLRRRFP